MELQASRFRGALSLAERPSLAQQSPELLGNSLPAERTTCKGISLIAMSDRGLCPLDTHKPFFEGLDPKIYGFISGKHSIQHSRCFHFAQSKGK